MSALLPKGDESAMNFEGLGASSFQLFCALGANMLKSRAGEEEI
jgi:hypothetical protein